MWPIAQQTLLCGGNVYVHCIAGRHRGATVAALMHSLISGQSFADSVQHINGIRDVQIERVLRESGVEMGERNPSQGPDRRDVPAATGLHRNEPVKYKCGCRRRCPVVSHRPIGILIESVRLCFRAF